MNKLLLSILLLAAGLPPVYAQIVNCTFIKNIVIKKDVYYEGAHGIEIDYTYNFDSLKTALHNDSLMDASLFTFTIGFASPAGNLKTTRQYKSLRNKNNEAEYSYVFRTKDFGFKDVMVCFVPYAALDIPEGKNTLLLSFSLNGKDGNGKSYEQYFPKQTVEINKKKQRQMTFNIDYVEVDKTDFKGEVWDFSPFGYNTQPDVATTFTVGNVLLWKMSVENTTVFAVGPKSKNIIFKISEGDEVDIKITDVDMVFDDFIGEYKIKPSAADMGMLHTIDKPTGKVIGCNMNWKAE